MRYTITEIASIVQGVFIQKNSNDEVQYVSTDTRQITHAAANLFFCLVARNNGHQYIISAYQKGIRNFIVSEKINIENYPDANFILVEKSITALQQFAKFHRAQFKIPVIGITGPPGAGKSTLTDALIGLLANQNKRVAVLCIDPSSPFNMGALLGDRIRMSQWYDNPDVYIRSLATRGSLGGLHPKIIEITDVLKFANFDYIIIEKHKQVATPWRNHYDRLVHLAYGLLIVVPVHEALRHVLAPGDSTRLRLLIRYLAVSEIMGTSMIYELIEWVYAVSSSSDAGPMFLGAQGDAWDAHKDMALATGGAVLVMLAGALRDKLDAQQPSADVRVRAST